MKSASEIERLAKKIRFSPNAAADERILASAEAAFEKSRKTKSAAYPPNIWRIIMKSRITKLAAAAVIIIAVIIGISHLGGPIDGASVAWAGLAERVAQIQTCIFQGHSSITGGPKGDINQEMKAYVSSEYGFRADTYAGEKLSMTQYMLPAEKVIISVMPEQKKYIRMLLTDEYLRKMRQQGSDPREMIKQFMSVEYTELGRDIIGGIEVEGIETSDPRYGGGTFENLVARLWVDVETDLPVQMEMEMQMEGIGDMGLMQMSMVMDGFEWDVELDSDIFEPNIPDDYTLMAEMKLPGQDEGSAVEGLHLFAEIADGNYPNEMNVMKIVQEVSKVMMVNFGKPGLGDDPNNKPSQQEQEKMMKKLMEKTMVVQGACMFYAELVKQDKDPAYYGGTVTVEDADAVLMRWKVSDGQYRVIFGDLTAENVSAEELAELEKGLVK